MTKKWSSCYDDILEQKVYWYGEYGASRKLPFGTKLTAAKRIALEMATQANREDNAGFAL